MTESRNYRLVHGGGDEAEIPHILIVGGGYLGMYTAKRLEKKLGAGEARITVIDPNSYMTYQPFLPEAAAARGPQKVARYVEELASTFSAFYRDCRVITDDKELTLARLLLCTATRRTVKDGLSLLGVTAPERM
jgi:NADPH-dependent 2,4-dienoyl-CoA reductase/sulfur reductase-like enzyme